MRINFFSSIIISLFTALATQAAEIRTTAFGSVSGVAGDYNTIKFLGIPYAAPPVGEARWKAPRDPQPWTGVLPGDQLKPACLQKGNFFANVTADKFGLTVGSEDCLYLNVWTPQGPSHKRPVVFWIHGGSNFKGTSRDPMYDGAFMAAKPIVRGISRRWI